jgi:hypothetical protein
MKKTNGKQSASILLLIGLLVLSSPLLRAAAVNEYDVKAAYLINFGKFVSWPEKTFANTTAPIVIGILGDDPFGDSLDRAVEGKQFEGRPFTVKRFERFDPAHAEALRHCQILFISYSEKDSAYEILKALEGSSVLTVAEFHVFGVMGGIITFDQIGDKINLILNTDAALKANLKISAKLMQVAHIYKK